MIKTKLALCALLSISVLGCTMQGGRPMGVQRAAGEGLSRLRVLESDELSRAQCRVVRPELAGTVQRNATHALDHLVAQASGVGGLSVVDGKNKQDSSNCRLVLDITTYTDRDGGRLGASSGAAVGFTVSLVSARAPAKTAWSAQYFYRDEPVSENLLKLKSRFDVAGGAGFASADELLNKGLKEAFTAFAADRDAAHR